jgi:DNA-nicking Smr family endonuclease
MSRRRRLSKEDRALWEIVARRTTPLPGDSASRPAAPRANPTQKPGPKPAVPAAVPPRFRVGEAADHRHSDDLLPGLAEQMSKLPVQMDAKAHGRLKRGKLRPEARIDLHGMTLAQAHPALIGFIQRAATDGRRLVLVITGKGKSRDEGGPIPTRLGVLRHQVPGWLAAPPLGPLVLQVTPAHQRHGGGGAYYVYLRRNR